MTQLVMELTKHKDMRPLDMGAHDLYSKAFMHIGEYPEVVSLLLAARVPVAAEVDTLFCQFAASKMQIVVTPEVEVAMRAVVKAGAPSSSPSTVDALAGKGPQRRPQRRFDRGLEEVAKAVGGGYCRLQMLLKLALGIRETVAGQRLGSLEGGGVTSPPPPSAKERTGDCPGSRKGTSTRRNVTHWGTSPPYNAWCFQGSVLFTGGFAPQSSLRLPANLRFSVCEGLSALCAPRAQSTAVPILRVGVGAVVSLHDYSRPICNFEVRNAPFGATVGQLAAAYSLLRPSRARRAAFPSASAIPLLWAPRPSAGVKVDAAQPLGDTALLAATERHNEDMVRILLELGANVHHVGRYNNTALMLAAVSGNPTITKRLLEHGARTCARDMWGNMPLDWALKCDQMEVVDLLEEAEIAAGEVCGAQGSTRRPGRRAVVRGRQRSGRGYRCALDRAVKPQSPSARPRHEGPHVRCGQANARGHGGVGAGGEVPGGGGVPVLPTVL